MMADTKPLKTSSAPADITRRVKEGHERILALFQQYLASRPDSRQALVEQILHELAFHFEMEENLVFEKLRMSGPEGRRRTRATEVEHEEIKAMILELQQAEGDDDQAWDEFFEDMMQLVRALFISEERDLLPLVDRSLDA
ncbi:MAG: hemerythrin domain-containing protein [Nitrospiraceae bacterium]